MRLRPADLRGNRLIRKLLPALRAPSAAERELRWLREELPSGRSLARACTLRGRSYPLQYLLGTQPFGPLDIRCARGVLIPRWETEEWALALVGSLEHPVKVLDLCTGTGCILFLLASRGCTGTGVDISPRCETIFKQNRRRLHFEQTRFLRADIREPITNVRAELVTANPPYIPYKDLKNAELSVRTFEPRLALIGDKDVYRHCVQRALDVGARGAVFEVGQADQIVYAAKLFNDQGWHTQGYRDAAGQPRTIWAWKGAEYDFFQYIPLPVL